MEKTETTDTFARAWAADDWTGQHLILAPKRAQPKPPTKPENPVQMHFTKRRKIVAELHEQGMTVPEMADNLGESTDKIYLDIRAIGVTAHPVDKKRPVVGDEGKARATFKAFCKRNKITQKQFRDTKRVVRGMANVRAQGLAEVNEASGASIAMMSRVTGLQEQTVRMALKRARAHEAQA
jgi:lambda repressor-like predicted transcriptional regulator